MAEMSIGSPTRDLFSYSVERIAVVALLFVVAVLGIWVYRSSKRHDG
jgi:hypothetical protein